jgi:hypothetical protein
MLSSFHEVSFFLLPVQRRLVRAKLNLRSAEKAYLAVPSEENMDRLVSCLKERTSALKEQRDTKAFLAA